MEKAELKKLIEEIIKENVKITVEKERGYYNSDPTYIEIKLTWANEKESFTSDSFSVR